MRSRASRPAARVGRAHVRKLAGLMTMILVALLLAACGSDDDNGDATEVATTVADIATEATTEEAAGTESAEVATSEATPEVDSVVPAGGSSPVAAALPGGMATPASAELPPSVVGTPAASPVAATPVDAAVAPVAATGGDADATPAAEEVTLTGRVELAGAENEAWVMTNEGCAGIGANTDLKPGQQLVVRDATGAIVGVTMLAASDETDGCSWDFSVTVPDSPYYAVSIPMTVEHVFTRDDVEQSDGELVVPAA
jgi:hypothetical protein